MSLFLKISNDRLSWRAVVLDAAQEIELSLAIKDFEVLTSSADGGSNLDFISLPIAINYNKNKLALKNAIDSNVEAGLEIRGQSLYARLGKGSCCWEGSIYFTNYDVSESGNKIINAEFKSGLGQTLGNCKLCDLDLGSFLFIRGNLANLFQDENPYDGTNNVWASLKNFGGYRDLNYVPVECIELDIYDAAIIDAIEQKLGITIKSAFFKTEYFRRRMHTFGNECKWTGDVITAGLNTNQNVISTYPVDWLAGDWSISQSIASIQFTGDGAPATVNRPIMPYSGEATIKISYNALSISQASSAVQLYQINNLGSTLLAQQTIQLGQNEIELTGTFSEGDEISIVFNGLFQLSSTTEVSICLTTDLEEGMNIDIAKSLPCHSLSEWFKDLTGMYNLVPIFDNTTNCLIIEPKWDITLNTGEKVKGFYGSRVNADNWKDKGTCEAEQGDFIIQQTNRNVIFAYCEDDSDENIQDSYLACEIELSNKYPVGQTPITMPISANIASAPMPRQAATGFTNPNLPLIPTSLSYDVRDPNASDEKQCSNKMKALYKVGLVPGDWHFAEGIEDDDMGNQTNAGNPQTSYPYATMLDIGRGINIGWCDQSGLTGMLNTFYYRDIAIWNKGVRKTMSIHFQEKDLKDIVSLFRELKYIVSKCSGNEYTLLEEISLLLADDCLVGDVTFLTLGN